MIISFDALRVVCDGQTDRRIDTPPRAVALCSMYNVPGLHRATYSVLRRTGDYVYDRFSKHQQRRTTIAKDAVIITFIYGLQIT